MEAFQQRVVDEKRDLDAKLEKLNVFLKGDVFKGLSDAEASRLIRQSRCMGEYSGILGERIAAF